jgi:hypothetical protein
MPVANTLCLQKKAAGTWLQCGGAVVKKLTETGISSENKNIIFERLHLQRAGEALKKSMNTSL